MVRLIILAAFLFVVSPQAKAQTKIGDVILSNSIAVGKHKLILNGGGIREKYWMDMYVAGLYLTQKNSDATTIIQADEPMSIRMHIVSSLISSSKMEEAVNGGFMKATGNNTDPYKEKIQQFISAFKEEIKVGDVFEAAWIPGKGLAISKNGKEKTTISGLDFKQVAFAIWLGKDPADENLKNGMLGK